MNRLNKFLCIVLTVIFIFPLSIIRPAAAESPDISFSDSSAVSKFYGASGASLSFNNNEKALRVSATKTSAFAYLPISNFSSSVNYAVLTYKNQRANSDNSYMGKLDFLYSGNTVATNSIYYTKGYKCYSSVIDITSVTECDSMKITFFTDCVAGDMLYLYGISFFSSKEDAEASAKILSDNADGEIISKYSEKQLTLNSYELDPYMLPYWDTDIVYNEAAYPLLNRNGTINDITLMYDADKIVSVRSSTLTTEYKEGVDYELVDGKLRILLSGNIPCVKYTNHYFTYSANNTYRMLGGKGWVRFQEGTKITSEQIAITYVHSDKWEGFIPPNQGEKLSRTTKLLEEGKDLNIVFFGDSITNGGNSSSEINIAPYADVWTIMLEKQLNKLYPSANITCQNTSISGGSVIDAKEHVYDAIIPYNPDLLILALGTNDAQFKYPSSDVLSQMQYVIDAVNDRCPDCEIILLAPMFSNPECFAKDLFYEYREGYYRMAEADGIAVADLMEVHEYLLTRKNYTDMSANNLCHLNDTLARAYAQVLVKTITAENASVQYKTTTKNRIAAIANLNMYDANEKTLINSAITEANQKIDSANKVEEVRRIYQDTKDYINALPKSSESIAEKTDFKRLVFNNAEKTLLLTSNFNVNSYYHTFENSAAIEVSYTSDPHTSIVFSKKNIVSASENKYVVLTYKVPSTNSNTASRAQLFFCAGPTTVPVEAQSKSFDLIYDGQYHSVIFDLTDCSWWSGTVNQLRLDPFYTAARNDTFFLSSICMCSNADEANKTASYMEQTANGTYIGSSSTVLYDSADTLSLFGSLTVQKIIGDINDDKKINTRDIMLIRRIISGALDIADYNELIVDANGDSRIGTSDITLLKAVVVGSTEYKSIEIEEAPSNIEYSEENSAIKVSPSAGSFIYLSTNTSIEHPKYAAVVYKAASDCTASADIILSDRIDEGDAQKLQITCDDDYSCAIIVLPDGYKHSGLYLSTDKIKMEIDSFGIFETYKAADSFTYERMWNRKSAKVYNENITVKFDNEMAKNLGQPNNAEFANDNSTGILKLTVASGKNDPYVYLDLSSLGFSADEYKYIVYDYMLPATNSSYGDRAEIFLCAGDTTVPTARISTQFSVAKTGEFTKWMIDLTNASFWNGDVHGIRLDFFCNASVGDTCYIKSITFCKTQKDVLMAMSK